MIKVYWTRAIAPGSGERHFISPLRFQEPIFLNKDIDYKEFLGPELLHCPGIVEEMTKTVVIKSPVTVDLEYADDQNLKIHRQDPAFGDTIKVMSIITGVAQDRLNSERMSADMLGDALNIARRVRERSDGGFQRFD